MKTEILKVSFRAMYFSSVFGQRFLSVIVVRVRNRKLYVQIN